MLKDFCLLLKCLNQKDLSYIKSLMILNLLKNKKKKKKKPKTNKMEEYLKMCLNINWCNITIFHISK